MARRRGHAHLQALRESEGYPLDVFTSADGVRETILECTALMSRPTFEVWLPELLACVFYSIARQNKDRAEVSFGVADGFVGELWKAAPGSASALLARAVGNYSKARVLPRDDARRGSFLESADADVSAGLKLDPESPALLALSVEVDTARIVSPRDPNARTLAKRIIENCERIMLRAPLGPNAQWSLMSAHEALWDEGTDAEAVGHLEAAVEVGELLLVRDPNQESLHGQLALLLNHQLRADGLRDEEFLRILRDLLDHVGDSPPEDDLALGVLDHVEHDFLVTVSKAPSTSEMARTADRLFARMALTRGRALLRRGRDASATLRSACTIYERLLGANPEFAALHEDMAVVHQGLGNEEAVEREVNIVRRLRPERVPALRRALKTWMRRG